LESPPIADLQAVDKTLQTPQANNASKEDTTLVSIQRIHILKKKLFIIIIIAYKYKYGFPPDNFEILIV